MRYIGKFDLMISLPTKSISKILAFYLSTRLGYKESGEIIRYCRLVLQIFFMDAMFAQKQYFAKSISVLLSFICK